MGSVDEITSHLIVRPLALAVSLSVFLGLILSLRRPWARFFKRSAANIQRLFLIALPVAVLGFVCGYLSGSSREAAIGGLVSSALTLLGGAGIFAFEAKRYNFLKPYLGFSTLCFACAMLYGAENGAYDREFRQVERFNTLSEQEYRIRIYRKNLQLPDEPPTWITGTQEKK